jgi:predicted small lipoprotein YifL
MRCDRRVAVVGPFYHPDKEVNGTGTTKQHNKNSDKYY